MISVYSVGESENPADMGVRIELGKAGCVCLHPGIDHAILIGADSKELKALDLQGLREVLAVWAAEDRRPPAGLARIILSQWLRGDRP
jgi:hypothetical protein